MADTLSAGTTLQNGKYRIIRFISRSGLDFTYEAEHTLMNVRVLIKELYITDLCSRNEATGEISVVSHDKEDRVRHLHDKFVSEARAISQTTQPGIDRITDIFEENNTAYYVMDYIDGKSSGDVVKAAGSLSPATQTNQKPSRKNKSKLILIIAMLACVIGLAVGSWLYFKSDQAHKEQPAKSDTALTINVGDTEFKMVYVEGGSFDMGAQSVDPNGANYNQDAWDNESPVHNEKVGDFYIGQTEVTQGLWEAVMIYDGECADGSYIHSNYRIWPGDAPNYEYGLGANYPAYNVSYEDIVNVFLPRINRITGKKFRLPAEAEWEYAARGGNHLSLYDYSGSNNIDNIAWYGNNSGDTSHPVKTKQPNALGLYDMSGNVWEWCADYWRDNYDSSTEASLRVLRGGSGNVDAPSCRVTYRGNYDPGESFGYSGFRLALAAE